MAFDVSAPFVVLDDARGRNGTACVFERPEEIVVARSRAEVAGALRRLETLAAAGLQLAGYIGYEAGAALEPCLERTLPERRPTLPLLWMGAFGAMTEASGDALFGEVGRRDARASAPEPQLPAREYARAFAECQRLIAAGDVYQVNLTFPARVRFDGHPLALYARLRRAQRMRYGAVLWTGDAWLLSASPELFFELAAGRLTARPMKGTAPRRASPEADDAAAAALAGDAKNRAENLMITDLIRNDLARVCEAGSVRVSDAFAVERYPTVHQMTSTVTARLRAGFGPFDVIRAIFPCGSVTGAPKIRAMQVIDALEARPRGVYTGAIGWISPGGDARLNVAIRTIEVLPDGGAAMGVGSGIVADSDAASEWSECLEKMAFVTRSGRCFHLFETMAFSPAESIVLLPLHLARLEASAKHHGFAFDRHEICNFLQALVGSLKAPTRVKLTLARNGAAAIACAPMPLAPGAPVPVKLVPLPVTPDDPRLFHKTSDRDFYDGARRAAATFEVVFVRPDGHLTEGSIANVFVKRDGRLLTPPASDGLLPGVLRRHLIDDGEAVETRLRPADLAGGFLLGNALRGLFPAQLVDTA